MIATGVPVYFGSLPGPEPGVAIIGGYEDKGVVTQSQRWADRDFQRYAGLELQSCKDYHNHDSKSWLFTTNFCPNQQEWYQWEDSHSKLVDKQKRFQDTPKGKGRKLLVPYEVYLLTKHFPPQAKKFLDEQKSAGAKRKGNLRAANVKAGLLDINPDEDKGANLNESVFKRKSPSKVLLKTM
jgi:hypothetical protein